MMRVWKGLPPPEALRWPVAPSPGVSSSQPQDDLCCSYLDFWCKHFKSSEIFLIFYCLNVSEAKVYQCVFLGPETKVTILVNWYPVYCLIGTFAKLLNFLNCILVLVLYPLYCLIVAKFEFRPKIGWILPLSQCVATPYSTWNFDWGRVQEKGGKWMELVNTEKK